MTNELTIKSALKYLVKMQIEQGSVGFAVDNDHDHDCCWDDVLAWIEAQPSEDCISRQAVDDAIYDYSRSCDVNYEQIMEFIDNLPSVTPRRDLAETSQDCISREEMLKYQQYLHGKMSNEENHKLWNFIKGLPSVTPKYTDEAQPTDAVKCAFTTEEIAKSFIEDVEAVKDQLDGQSIDAVSREAVIRLVDQYPNIIGNRCSGLISDIKHLPPVTPERPKGKWIIKDGKEQGYDIAGIKTWYIQILCDRCGFIKTAIEGHTGQYHYCPNCGAEMSGGGDD